jgi:hypothetical protein
MQRESKPEPEHELWRRTSPGQKARGAPSESAAKTQASIVLVHYTFDDVKILVYISSCRCVHDNSDTQAIPVSPFVASSTSFMSACGVATTTKATEAAALFPQAFFACARVSSSTTSRSVGACDSNLGSSRSLLRRTRFCEPKADLAPLSLQHGDSVVHGQRTVSKYEPRALTTKDCNM